MATTKTAQKAQSADIRKFGIQCGWHTNRIQIGRVNKAQNAFLDGREDHTDDAIWAVAEHVENLPDGTVELTNSRGVTYRIRAEKISEAVSNNSEGKP